MNRRHDYAPAAGHGKVSEGGRGYQSMKGNVEGQI